MSVLDDLASPELVDLVPAIAVMEGVYLITFAGPIGADMTAPDAVVDPSGFDRVVVASLALTKSAAMSLASRLSMLITRQERLEHYRTEQAAQLAAQKRN